MSWKIEVVPYNPEWPQMFEEEAAHIKQTLGDACVAIHHVGSTAVLGLCAKPKIDIIAVVKEGGAQSLYTHEVEPYYQLQEKHGIEFFQDPTLEDFLEQLDYIIERLYLHAGQANVIFDRCPIDFIAYSMHLLHQEEMNLYDSTFPEKFPEIKEALELRPFSSH